MRKKKKKNQPDASKDGTFFGYREIDHLENIYEYIYSVGSFKLPKFFKCAVVMSDVGNEDRRG